MFQKVLDLLFSGCVILLILWFLWEARDWSFYSRLFPWSIGFTVLMLALLQLSASLRNFRSIQPEASEKALRDVRPVSSSQTVEQLDHDSDTRRLLIIGCWIIIFFMGIWLLGFRLGSLVLTFAFLKLAAKESYRNCLWLAAVNYSFFLIIFDVTLGVPLFQGHIGQWLGIDSVDGFIFKGLIGLWT